MKKPTKRRKQTIRQTSDELSSLAAAIVSVLRGVPARASLVWYAPAGIKRAPTATVQAEIPVRHVRRLCMSLINQDQTKGKRKAKRDRK